MTNCVYSYQTLIKEVEKAKPIVLKFIQISNKAMTDYKSLCRYAKLDNWSDDMIYRQLLLDVWRIRRDYCRSEAEYHYYYKMRNNF